MTLEEQIQALREERELMLSLGKHTFARKLLEQIAKLEKQRKEK